MSEAVSLRRVEDPNASPLRTESVDRSALSQGDHVLVLPGGRVGVDGRIANATLSAADLAGVAAPTHGDAVLEDADGDRRPARIGGRTRADETLRNAPVVVRVGRSALVPWLQSLVPADRLPRSAVLALVLVLALVGAGISGFDPDDSDATTDASLVGATPGEYTPPSTPTPPLPVTATPPVDGSGTPETTRASEGSIDVSVADPAAVRQRDGRPTTVSAALTGNVTADGRADSVVVVVQSWVPGHGWAEVTSTSRSTGDTVSLGDLFGEVVLAANGRAAGFDNPNDGTTAAFRGRVSVTAVMFDGGQEIGRLSATDGYTLRVTNLAAPSGDLVLGDGAAAGSLFGTDGLRSGDGTADGGPGAIEPGSSGTNTVPIRNRGSGSGTLSLSSVSILSFENGRTGPESAVDATGGDPGRGAGELQNALELRLSIERADGSRVWVFGDGTAFRPIGALADGPLSLGRLASDERVELVVEYRLPGSTGNEVQTDSITVDVWFTLSGADD
ncbi:hypothetical protein B4589_000545 [Halolamina sp. CBA1230]|uniref:hypothetical protein n=1 Tax=Halolamina sp. CBA1230 TaxID=1853690 RepID=UPI0009A23BDB|nr:hypothetical protein [Halolamina sp. CBA1230]QKY18930.1 hypothetical protein B4589_000545 [Halolamina sp. CBA1230]